jgi:hypothetical protein
MIIYVSRLPLLDLADADADWCLQPPLLAVISNLWLIHCVNLRGSLCHGHASLQTALRLGRAGTGVS